MESINKCVVGTKIFIKDPLKVWACAEIIAEEDSHIIVKTEDDETKKLKSTDEFFLRNLDVWDSCGLSAPSDLTQLTHLHEASVLHSLNVRFDIDEIYTFTGPILIAVNPFKTIENLYSDSILAKHIQSSKSKNPHIFATSNSAYLGLCNHRKSQTILISGESGAGKTESTKYVMKFLACAGSDLKKRSLIENQVLESNPLLEAFGNSRTLRNDNSSRFGKYIELQFDLDEGGYVRGKLCGAKILTYLLEKVRVCDQQEGERNYHIFYQLCKAVEIARNENKKEDEKKIYEKNFSKAIYHFPMTKKFKQIENVKPCTIDFSKFKSHKYFRYLTKSSVYELNEVDEQQEFESTIYAMQTIGITEEEQFQIFRVLQGILYIGNIVFNNDDSKEEAHILDGAIEDLKNASYMLDINEEQLKDALCYKIIIANNEYYKKPNNSDTAGDVRDALARAIYGCLFLKVVERTNESIGFMQEKNLFCGVLDIFGFESFPLNSFEQLCINYTNECLQQFFNNFIFKCEEKLYIEENIRWDPLDFPDNQDCVDILESKPFGIFSMLDEECHIPSGKDKTFCSKIVTKHKENKRFQAVKTDPSCFIIVHFAGIVKYSSVGFMEKNKDQLSLDTQNVLLESKNKYISTLFEKYLRRSADKRKFVTVSSEFKEQLNQLMQRIKLTEPHFIRCIKPNSTNHPDLFDRISVNEQLKYGGVLQAVKVSRAGYPVRLSHKDCVFDYKILLNREEAKEFDCKWEDKSYSEQASYILDRLYLRKPIQEYLMELRKSKEKNLEEDFYARYSKDSIKMIKEMKEVSSLIWSVGKSLCFFKSDAYNLLSTLRSEFRSSRAIIIQKNYKCYSKRKQFLLMKKNIILLQRWMRKILAEKRRKQLQIQRAKELICTYIYAYSVRKKYLHKRACAIRIQSHVKGYLTRKKFAEYKVNYYSSVIQAMWRGYKERQSYIKLKQATMKIQLKWKSVLARRQLKRLKQEAKEVGNLLSKNQQLMKELQEEKNRKDDLESRVLKARATIDKLHQEVHLLEKGKKEHEAMILQMKEQIQQMQAERKKEKEEWNERLAKIPLINGATIKGRTVHKWHENIDAHNVIEQLKKKEDKEHLLLLMNRIKELEIENQEIVKQNCILSDRYNKLLNIVSQLKNKTGPILNSSDFNKLISNKYSKTYSNLSNNLFGEYGIDGKIEQGLVFRRNENAIDILVCGPKLVGKTSLLEDLFVRLGDDANLNLLRKNRKLQWSFNNKKERFISNVNETEHAEQEKESRKSLDSINSVYTNEEEKNKIYGKKSNEQIRNEHSSSLNYNSYEIIHKNVKIKIVDCECLYNKNLEEPLISQIKNAMCIIVVFDSTKKESINPALHLLQEASLINVKRTTKLYLVENIFNEKINLTLNTNANDVTYALKIAKSCNAYYVKTLDIYSILNDYANEVLSQTNGTLREEFFNQKEKQQKRWKEEMLSSYTKSISTGGRNTFDNYSSKFNELMSKFDMRSDVNKESIKEYSRNEHKGYTNFSRSSNRNAVTSVVSTLKAFCGIQNKPNQNSQFLKESLPSNMLEKLNNNNGGTKKYHSELGKGLQPVCEASISNNVPITYLVIGKDTIHKNYTLLAVGEKEGVVFIYKIFKTKLEMNYESSYQRDDLFLKNKELLQQSEDKENGYISSDQRKRSDIGEELSSVDVENMEENPSVDNNDNITNSVTTTTNKNNANIKEKFKSVELLSRLVGHKKAVTCIVFSLTEDKIITSSIDKSIRIWEVSTGFPLKVFSDSSATLAVLLYPNNPDMFICSNCNSLLRIVDLKCGALYQKLKMESEVRALEIDDTGLHIFGGSKCGTIYVIEVHAEGIEIRLRNTFSSASITSIKFVSRNSIKQTPCLFVNSCDNNIGIVDCIYGKEGLIKSISVRSRINISHSCLPIRNCYSKFGGGWIVSGTEDKNIFICSMFYHSNYKPILLKHHKAAVISVVVNEMDTLMVSGDTKGNLVFWRRSFT